MQRSKQWLYITIKNGYILLKQMVINSLKNLVMHYQKNGYTLLKEWIFKTVTIIFIKLLYKMKISPILALCII
jgi:hypothetical protein